MDKSEHAPPPAGFAVNQNYGGHQIPPPPYNDGQPGQPSSGPNIVIVGPPQFGPVSQRLTCPYCHATVSTSVETEANSKTHLFALLLCVFGLWCCAPCPYCIDSCMVKKHYCPSCKAYLGESVN